MNKINSLGIDFWFNNGKPSYFTVEKKFGNLNDQLEIARQNLESILGKKVFINDESFIVE